MTVAARRQVSELLSIEDNRRAADVAKGRITPGCGPNLVIHIRAHPVINALHQTMGTRTQNSPYAPPITGQMLA